MSAAITSVYVVIASWTPWIVVSRSATICEIDTFMTLLSSTITNCAEARMPSGSHSAQPRNVAPGAGAVPTSVTAPASQRGAAGGNRVRTPGSVVRRARRRPDRATVLGFAVGARCPSLVRRRARASRARLRGSATEREAT